MLHFDLVRWTLLGALLAAPLSLSGCSDEDGEAQAAAAAPSPAALVRVAEVERRSVAREITLVGTVRASRTSVIASGSSGIVAEFLVDEGEYVEEGEVLSRLRMESTDLGIAEAESIAAERAAEYEQLKNGSRPAEIEEAAARRDAAKATRDSAARKYERIRRLAGSGAINQDDIDAAQEQALASQHLYDAADAAYQLVKEGPREEEIAQAKARLQAQRDQVAYLKSEREKRITRAPFSGYIVEKFVEVGQWADLGAPIITIAQLDEVDIVANVDQRDLDQVHVGQDVSVYVEAREKKNWTGKVFAIISRSDWSTGSRSFPVKVRVRNELRNGERSPRPALREGMLARVSFVGPEQTAVLVPKDAIIRSDAGSSVFQVVPGEAPDSLVVRPVAIREGQSFGSYVALADEALNQGDRVVREGTERLRPFQEIQILPPADAPNGPAPSSSAAANEQ